MANLLGRTCFIGVKVKMRGFKLTIKMKFMKYVVLTYLRAWLGGLL